MVYTQEARANFVGINSRKTVERLFYVAPVVRNYDPLAQTFQLSEDSYITSVGLFFGSKDTVKPVVVQIRDVVNGYPGPTVYAQKTLLPASVNVSDTAALETKVTFPDPFFASANTEYCVSILTASTQYSLWVATLGKKDVQTNINIFRQPYEVGVLFSSSNASAWTAHQDKDLKFKIYKASFTGTGILRFGSVAMDAMRFVVMGASQIVPDGAAIAWQLSRDGGATWQAINYDDITQLTGAASNAIIRAVMTGAQSGVINHASASVLSMKYKGSGTYLSRELEASTFSSILCFLDEEIPSGCTVAVDYSTDSGSTWTAFGAAVSSVQVDHQFYQYRYEASVSSKTKIKIRIRMTSSDTAITPKCKRLIVIVS